MDIIQASIKKPVVVSVGIFLILIFGFLALYQLPMQLTPTVTEPQISVKTTWAGATPLEIERDVIEEQEDALKEVPGLIEYESTASDNEGTINLKFAIGTDLDKAMLDVSNKLNEVGSYPENVDKPVISANGDDVNAVIWLMLQTKEGNTNDIDTYKTFFDNEVKEQLDRIEGVGDLFAPSGTEAQMHVVLDNEKLAAYNLTIDEVIATIQQENVNISAGTMYLQRRSYRIRTTAQYGNIKDLEDVVLKSDGQRRILLRDVAKIAYGYGKKYSVIFEKAKEGLVMGVEPRPDANVVELTNRVEAVVNSLNEGLLAKEKLEIRWLYDQRKYITGAVDTVQNNIIIGACLAIVVLLLFLRSASATTVVGLAIPISVIATFIIFEAMGRSLNTISLAGISFAVGMLVDSAIVVIENIDRHRRMGKGLIQAAHDGTGEVWGALIASALTTIAVFVPIIFLEDEAGQLFKDIAIAATASVTFSLFVSISVIPMLWTLMFRFKKDDTLKVKENKSFIVRIGDKFVGLIMFFVKLALRNKLTQALTITALVAFSAVSVKMLFPKMEYLPQGNQNLVFNILIPPPGLSYQEQREMGESLFERYMPYVGESKEGFPAIDNLFYVSSGSFIIFGATALEEDRAKELIPLFLPGVNSFPGVFGISKQAGVFEQGVGEGNTVNIDLSGESIEKIANAGGMMFGALMQQLQGAQVRPVPSVELIFPEVRFIPDRDRLRAVGLNSQSLGIAADVLMDGRKIGDFKEDGKKKIDLVVKADEGAIDTPEKLYRSLVATPNNGLVPMSTLSSLERTTGISQIRHLNGKRTITLQVTPPPGMTIEELMGILEVKVIPAFKANGTLDGVDARLSGTADKLKATVGAMKWNFILAIGIIYLLMAALFSNFFYPLVILFTVPLAAAGGFIGLSLTNAFVAPQALDILTMLGFIILVGTVVNNAILIVHQALNYVRGEGMEHKLAVLESTKSRLRPIFMSTLTTVFGMLPLVLIPGPGSEFYRGLGSVITGGLAFSTLFTLFVIPALLMFFIKFEKIATKKGEA